MEKNIQCINGECGEQLSVSPTRFKEDGKNERECVIIEIDGLVKDSNGDLSIILSPFMAKRLAKELEEYADEAYEVNYNILGGNTF